MNRETSLVPCLFTAEQLALVKKIKACKDFYSIVGAKKDASVRRIRKSYKQLALKLHPDKNHAPGAEDAFKMLTNAVAILSDRETRRHYDNYLNIEEESDEEDEQEPDADDEAEPDVEDDDELQESEESQLLHRRHQIMDLILFFALLISATFLSMELFGIPARRRTEYALCFFDGDIMSDMMCLYFSEECRLFYERFY